MNSGGQWIFISLAFIAGVGVTSQAASNSAMRAVLGHPVAAAIMNFIVGSISILLYKVVTGSPWPDPAKLASAPWWTWLGGFFGAFMVVLGILAVPRIGAAVFFAMSIAGQMVSSSIIDHYGLFGVPVTPFSPMRLGAILMVVGGVGLLRLK